MLRSDDKLRERPSNGIYDHAPDLTGLAVGAGDVELRS